MHTICMEIGIYGHSIEYVRFNCRTREYSHHFVENYESRRPIQLSHLFNLLRYSCYFQFYIFILSMLFVLVLILFHASIYYCLCLHGVYHFFICSYYIISIQISCKISCLWQDIYSCLMCMILFSFSLLTWVLTSSVQIHSDNVDLKESTCHLQIDPHFITRDQVVEVRLNLSILLFFFLYFILYIISCKLVSYFVSIYTR